MNRETFRRMNHSIKRKSHIVGLPEQLLCLINNKAAFASHSFCAV